MKKIFFTILLISVAMNSVYATPFPYTYGGQTLYYDIITGTNTVKVTPDTYNAVRGYYWQSYYHKPTGGYLFIPDSVCYNNQWYYVTSIEHSTFENITGLTGVNIGSKVKSIGSGAFQGCSGIHNINLPIGLESIGHSAFRNCGSLDYLVIPDGVTNIYHCAFLGTNIDSIYLGCNINYIGEGVFQGGANLRYIYYNVKNLGKPLFYDGGFENLFAPFYNRDMPNFTTLIIGDSVQVIYSDAFGDRNTITQLFIPDNVISVGHNAFKNCSGINSLYVGCDTIGDSAFQNCSSIGSITWGNSVVHIGNNAFQGCSNINSLVIPDNVLSIGYGAFMNCSGINSLTIGSGVTIIGEGAFQGCSNINSLVIPDNVLSIGSSAFMNCSSIDSLFIGEGVTVLGNNAFRGCQSIRYLYYTAMNGLTEPSVGYHNTPFEINDTAHLSTVVVGDSVQIIPDYLFYNCTGIDSLYISSGVQSIGAKAFSGCSSIKQLSIPNNVSFIGDSAFAGCSSINRIHLSNGLDTIRNNVFSGCSGIRQLIIPNEVVRIGTAAFEGCSGIDSLYLGSGVQTIKRKAFSGCTGLQYMHYNARNCSNALFATGANAPFANTNTPLFTTLVIGDSVNTIPSNAFENRTSIDSLYVGSRTQSIGTGAFSGCTGIKYMYYNARNCNDALFATGNNAPFANTNTPLFNTLVVGDSVSVIPANAFYNRSSISNVLIGSNVQTIGSGAFRGCAGISQLTIPDGVLSIGDNAFYGCSGIDSLNIGSALITIENSVFQNCSSIQNLIIPENIVSIGSNAFYGCISLENVSFGSSVVSIGNSAFQGCTGFSKLLLPESVTSIGSNAFYGCSSIDSLYIGCDVQTIGSGAFRGCTGLTWLNYNASSLPTQGFYGCTQLATLFLGNNVQSIGSEAFYNCDNLLSANISANQIGSNAFADCDRLVTVTLGESTQTLGDGAFSGCFRLQNIDLGGVTAIGDSAFNGCVRLERPELPANLTTIGTRAFNDCNLLSGKLTFPATITSIEDYAYSSIGSITEIEMQGANPPTIYANTFASVSNSTPVSVPCGAVLNYYTTDYWENFSNVVEAPPYHLTVASNNDVMGSAALTQQPTCSNHSAIIQATAETGFHFIQWSDGNGTNPRTVQLTQDSSFTAIFVPNNSQITIEPNDPLMGTTTGSGTYGWNAPVTMTATAYSGYHFLHWNDGNTQNPRYMAAVRDTTFTAIFVSNVSTITVGNANPDMGNVSGSGVYYYQNQVSITATPNYGYHFTQWNDGNTLNPRTITVSQDSTFTAFFALNTYNIVASSNSTTMGSVTGGGSYTYLHEMSMTATPAYGYHFVQWNDQNTDNPRTITVTRDSAFTAQFAANNYAITAEPNDPTMGSAYGSGTYNFNTTATLTAVAEYGYHFTQWSDGVTNNPRLVTVQNSATYTAQFEINSYILTVQSSNPAIGTTSGGGSYNYLTPVNITAIPNAGYHFTQWSDGNTDNPRLVNVIQNATYTAQFAINSYAVGVTCNNSNMGSVSGSGTYNHNSVATLSATAYYGYHFVQWQDGNTQNPRSVVVTDSTQYIAQFDYNSYLVTANSSNMTIGIATGGGSYNYLSQVALTAVPTPHYHFTMWNDSIEDNPRTITVTRDSVFTAHFAIDRHTIGVISSDATRGSVSGTDTVDYNTAVWISATANYGYHFTQWNDGNTQNPRRVVVLQDTVFTASFAANQYTATCNVNDEARGMATITTAATPQAGAATYQGDYLSALTFTASPYYGYHFVQWNDGMTDNPRQVTLTKDTALTAYFDYNTYTISLSANDSTLGSVQGGGEYNYLSQVTITATAAQHCHFVQWNDGNTTNPRLLTLTADSSFTAIFEQDQQFTITVIANDTARGSTEGSGTYFLGETATISATACDHYYFAQWSDGITSNPRTVTVMGDATYTAVFEPVSYILTVTANDYSWGSVSGGGTYPYGSVADIAAQPFDGYIFNGWSDGDSNATRQIVIEGDLSLEARFEKKNTEGIGDLTDDGQPAVSVKGHAIIVTGAEGLSIAAYDALGRKMAAIKRATAREELALSAADIYIVKIENHKAIKCIVR